MRRELHSIEHTLAWATFEKLLMYRANFAFLTKLIYMAGVMALGNSNYHESEEFMKKEDSVFDRECVNKTYTFAKNFIIIMGFGRLLLMLVSFKKLEVCKVYFYYMQLYKLVEQLLPRDYGSVRLKLTMQYDLLDFCMLYFNFWPSLITILVSHFTMFFIQMDLYQEEFTSAAFIGTFAGAVWQTINISCIHLVFNWVGNTFVKTELSKRGNEGILNNLSEGVVIVDQESGIVQFRNKAAKRFNISKNKLLGMFLNPGVENNLESTRDGLITEENFAHIDKKLFKPSNLDSRKTLQHILKADDYRPI